MPHDPYVTASDIGTHAFCARALHLKDAGVPSSLGQSQQAGVDFHDMHGARVRGARRDRVRSIALFLAAAVLLAFAILFR
jgi:hypothetical protein